jgi:antitoxin PrlF
LSLIREGALEMVKSKSKERSTPVPLAANCCRVESIVSVDDRGQMVLPKELREKAKIKAGDKFALVSWDKNGEVCCLYLIKTDFLAETVKDFLGPMLKE